MGSVHAKLSSTRRMKEQHGSKSSSIMGPVLIQGIMLALAASTLPLLVIYRPPSLKLFLFDLIPTLWRCSCDLFTPTNLFVLLNLIILTILAMAHLHSNQDSSASSSLSLPLRPAHPDCAQETADGGAENRSLSEEFKLDSMKSADLQLLDEVDSTNEQIIDQPPTKHGADKADHRDNRAITCGKVIQETIIDDDGQQGVDDGQHFAERSRKAEEESKKAEKAKTGQSAPAESKTAEKAEKAKTGQTAAAKSKKAGNPLQPDNTFYNIDSLLSEEGSIFTRVESRPLPSARFSPKKGPRRSAASLDRPLSPLKMSRPILKRGDTLDATWKAICESKRHSSPLNRHYSSKHTRKVDPSEDILDGVANKPTTSAPLSPLKQRSKILMSSLHDKEVLEKAYPLKRREPSMPQEELNARVESFISRFNEQIRIQREKSLLDYMEMVGRGSS